MGKHHAQDFPKGLVIVKQLSSNVTYFCYFFFLVEQVISMYLRFVALYHF